VRDVCFQTQIFSQFQDLGVAIIHESDRFFWGDVICLHQPPKVRVEVLFDFINEILAQEEFLFPGAFSGVADVIIPPQVYPGAQVLQFLHPVLADYLRGYIR
jgi:hypothetical protein